jgi:uncharacterized protein (DUF1800 family)
MEAAMSSREAAVAVRRFGLGAAPGDLKRVATDPRGYVLAALSDPSAARLTAPGLLSPREIHDLGRDANLKRRDSAMAAGPPAEAAETARAPGKQVRPTAPRNATEGAAGKSTNVSGAKADRTISKGELLVRFYMDEARARIAHAQSTDKAFLERLVIFWSNHFCVGGAKGNVIGIAGAFERDAIRPHVLGRFADMLLAVEQHPAMLLYLDNNVSMGPNSSIGLRQRKGLNENLAREILELHTLGVDGGYAQADVTNLARLITGWSVADNTFNFLPAWHEPGTWTVLGRAYASGGVESGRACLLDIARHPSTARFVATKLATHFVSDNPSPALVARLAATFQQTDGNLAAVSKALATSPEAWSEPPRKSVPPYDFAIAMARGFGLKMELAETLRLANLLGQPLWKPSSPKGFPDGNDSWIGAPAVRERLRFAEAAVRGIDPKLDPRQTAEVLLGGALGPKTREAIARAETREQGFEILIMSPEFQRR